MIDINDEIYEKINDIYCENKSFEIISELEFMHARFSVFENEKLNSLSKEERNELLRRLIEDEATTNSYELVDYLVENDKIYYFFGSNFDQFIDLYKKNIEENWEVIFYSPVTLTTTFKNQIKSKLLSFFGSNSRIVYLIDSDLIAGCKVNYKNKIYDLSLKNHYPKIIGKYLRQSTNG